MNGSVYASSLSVEKRASAKYLRVSGKVPEPGLSKMPRGDKKKKKKKKTKKKPLTKINAVLNL